MSTSVCWELICDGLVFHPGRVQDSHLLNSIETGDKCRLHTLAYIYSVQIRYVHECHQMNDSLTTTPQSLPCCFQYMSVIFKSLRLDTGLRELACDWLSFIDKIQNFRNLQMQGQHLFDYFKTLRIPQIYPGIIKPEHSKISGLAPLS